MTETIPYASLPGPKGAPLLGIAHKIDRQAFHQQLEGWAREYGPRFRFNITHRRFMAVADPEAIMSILKQRPQAFLKTPRLQQVAKDLGFHGVFSANGDAWKRQRQLVLPGLDPAHLQAYLPNLVAVTGRLRTKWVKAAADGAEIDLLADLMRYTVDVTTGLAFGHDLNTMEQGDEVAIQRHLNHILPALYQRVLSPFDLQHWLPRRETKEHVAALQAAVQGFIARTRELLAQRPELRDKPQNLIQSLVATRDAEQGISDEDLAGNVLTMLLAGEDTTANTLAWLVWLLVRNPEALARCRAEVEATIGAGQLATRLDQLAALDYVDAATNEAMRIKPVAPLNILQAGNDVEIDGVQVPAGTFVVCVMRAPAVDAERFPEPDAFRPERWVQGDSSGAEGRMFSAKRVVMPFGAGPRICPGRYLALAEIKMVMAMLLANFEIADVSCEAGEPPERLMLTMSPVGLKMKLRARA